MPHPHNTERLKTKPEQPTQRMETVIILSEVYHSSLHQRKLYELVYVRDNGEAQNEIAHSVGEVEYPRFFFSLNPKIP